MKQIFFVFREFNHLILVATLVLPIIGVRVDFSMLAC